MKTSLTLLVLCISTLIFAQSKGITGVVFEDANGNGIKESKEKGIAGVVVSDQLHVAVTDTNGAYSLKSTSGFPYVLVSQPTGFSGKFYYPKAEKVNFPLSKTKDQNNFRFIHASDTHVDSLNLPRMARFREMVDSIGVDFVIVTGDLIRDALRVNEETASNYYKMYLQEIKKLKVPVYSSVGNHELFGIERDKSLVSSEHPLYGKGMYRHFLGPDYYSFNYGGIHFVAVDGVDYQNLYYFGGVDSIQLQWLENDLKHLPDETPVVTFNHIPFVSPGFSFQEYDNHIFYGPQLLEQDGKLEHRHIVYNFEDVKKRIGNHPYPLALSGHYHSAQEGQIMGDETRFVQTSAITRPDEFEYNGFKMKSGFTVYEVKEGQIVSSIFTPLDFKSP
ncbi:metallophosphoesterase [Muricauda sp. MAR_2010_75]|uniref:metallophosphoesterase n=1 Tax=Allomuricauda sp. MAR_2010_75 TaxID=1250232 RepID=UPI0005651733|nr:metallophosphoesterase [Muricauda sp. MAR_2010_75]